MTTLEKLQASEEYFTDSVAEYTNIAEQRIRNGVRVSAALAWLAQSVANVSRDTERSQALYRQSA